MADSEADVISHLLDVEQNAFLQVKAAQEKANKIVGEARSQADSQFNQKFEELSLHLEEELNSEKNRVIQEHNSYLSNFKEGVQKKSMNKSAFEAFIKKAL